MSDYPTDAELTLIKQWQPQDGTGLLAYVRGLWWNAEWGWDEEDRPPEHVRPYRLYSISTAGWSGNEELIGAMRENWMWWNEHWYTHRTGGHFQFRVETPHP